MFNRMRVWNGSLYIIYKGQYWKRILWKWNEIYHLLQILLARRKTKLHYSWSGRLLGNDTSSNSRDEISVVIYRFHVDIVRVRYKSRPFTWEAGGIYLRYYFCFIRFYTIASRSIHWVYIPERAMPLCLLTEFRVHGMFDFISWRWNGSNLTLELRAFRHPVLLSNTWK